MRPGLSGTILEKKAKTCTVCAAEITLTRLLLVMAKITEKEAKHTCMCRCNACNGHKTSSGAMCHKETYAQCCLHCHRNRCHCHICIPRLGRKHRSAPMPSRLGERGWRWQQLWRSCARMEFFLGRGGCGLPRFCGLVLPAPNVPRGRKP